MAELVHEIWIDPDEHGQTNNTLVLAGPAGDEARKMMGPNSELLHSFSAGSHFEAMTIYYRFWEWGPYTTNQECAYEPYSEADAKRQRTGRRNLA